MFGQILQGIADLVFPPFCVICKNRIFQRFPEEPLCPRCLNSVIFNSPPFCPKCSRHMPRRSAPRCRSCRRRDYRFDFAWAATRYNNTMRCLIHAFKYSQKPYLNRCLARLMTEFIELHRLDILQFDLIVPVPLHSARLRERGYNQARLLAHDLSRHFSIPLCDKRLRRHRHTEHQALLHEKNRFTNIQGAFTIKHSRDFKGKNLLLVDDLLTTGYTLSEAARMLKASGAGTVGAFVLSISEKGLLGATSDGNIIPKASLGY